MTTLFNRFRRLIDFCERTFYAVCPWLLRKIQSKGYGVHSPFAFDLITNVIHSSYSFYAFSDIRETVLKSRLDPYSITGFNRLSFRLVHYLQAEKILEINSGNGINTLFLTTPSSRIHCWCVEENSEKIVLAMRLLRKTGRRCQIVKSLSDCEIVRYDAIFINLTGSYIPDIHTLMELSSPDAFWVLHPIKKRTGKQFWNEIVHDVKVRVTVDLGDTGIAFLRPDLHKENYLV